MAPDCFRGDINLIKYFAGFCPPKKDGRQTDRTASIYDVHIILEFFEPILPSLSLKSILGGAATCSEGFVMFSKSSLCLLGQHGSCSIAHQPGELSEKINKTFGTSGHPPGMELTL